MAKHEVEVSPRALARVAGVLYLITIVVGIFNEAFVKGRIVVPLDRSGGCALCIIIGPADALRNRVDSSLYGSA